MSKISPLTSTHSSDANKALNLNKTISTVSATKTINVDIVNRENGIGTDTVFT